MRFVIMDKTSIHLYIPETKQQPKQWTFLDESALKKTKTFEWAGKVVATIFWDSQEVVLIDYLWKERTIMGQYYSDLVTRFDAVLKEKRPTTHSSRILVSNLNELHYELVSHASYSPD